jgi:hypothetical protein
MRTALRRQPEAAPHPSTTIDWNAVRPRNQLRISQPGDRDELEASLVADAARIGSDPPAGSTVRRRDAGQGFGHDFSRVPLHAERTDDQALPSTGVRRVLATPGRPLDRSTKEFFEPRLGVDLGLVRIHDDGRAAVSARAFEARAYTVGSDIVFGSGEYGPANHDGRALLAHELAHVRQGALDRSAGAQVRRSPCPSCHKPTGTQGMAIEDLDDNDAHYLPDEDAAEFFVYLKGGYSWAEYKGGKRTRTRSVRRYDYDGSSQILGYVLDFSDAHLSYGDRHVQITVDVYGNELQVRADSDAIESVMSPIDFIGPGLLARPVVGGVRAVAGGTRALAGGVARAAPRIGSALAGTARNVAFSARLTTSEYLGAAMRGGAEFPALAAEGGAQSAFVMREGGEVAAATTRAGRVVTEASESTAAFNRPPVRATGPSFSDVSADLGLERPGTIRYRSTAEAARGAEAGGLVNASRPGFQSHSTASSVRRAFAMSGRQWQSAHIVPQAVYRALRARGWQVGRPFSEGRAFTTMLSSEAHAAFDRTWITEWRNAVAAGRTIRAGDVYTWVSDAINAVDNRLIDVGVKGAINQRLRSELFIDLGLDISDVIIVGHP